MNMRAVWVIDSFQAEAGSPAICVRGCTAAFARHGVALSVHALDGSVPDAGDGVEVALREQLVGADLVHFHGPLYGEAAHCAQAARRAGVPFVLSPLGSYNPATAEGVSFFGRIGAMLAAKPPLRLAASIAAMNDSEAAILRKAQPGMEIVTLPPGIDFAGYAREADVRRTRVVGERLLLMLAPLHPEEGVVAFLKAIAETGLEAEGWHIVVAGADRGDFREQLASAVRRKGGADRVELLSANGIAEQKALLGRADLLVAPSLQPRCSASIMQAAAMGVAVVATDPAVPDELRDVICTCPATRGGLRSALRSVLMQSDDERGASGVRLRERASATLDWPVLAERYAALYGRYARKPQ